MRRCEHKTQTQTRRAKALHYTRRAAGAPHLAKSVTQSMRNGRFETASGRQTNENINTMISQDTRLIDLTVAQLEEVIDQAVRASIQRNTAPKSELQLVYGIKGIAGLFGVSERQARNIKSSGVISRAIRQQGRTIVTDAALALQLFGKRS